MVRICQTDGRRKITQKYLEWKPEGKPPVGRPRKRWREGVDKALRRRDTEMREVEERRSFDDRMGWRKFLR